MIGELGSEATVHLYRLRDELQSLATQDAPADEQALAEERAQEVQAVIDMIEDWIEA